METYQPPVRLNASRLARAIRAVLVVLVVATLLTAVAHRLGLTDAAWTHDLTRISVVGADDASGDNATGAATGMHPSMSAALRAAQHDAAAAGYELTLTSGFRTPEHQLELLEEAIAKYGSVDEATKWVFRPGDSQHVAGLAADVGGPDAAAWLRANGAAYGLCQTLDWEWWHFEWNESWQTNASCPTPAVDVNEALYAIARRGQ